MNKVIKQIISFFLIITITMAYNINVSAATSHNSLKKGLTYLYGLGLEDKDIDILSDEEIMSYAGAKNNQTLTKYYKVIEEKSNSKEAKSNHVTDTNKARTVEITKEEYFNQVAKMEAAKSNKDNIISRSSLEEDTDIEYSSDGYYCMSLYSTVLSNGDNKLSARFEWLKNPFNRKIDVFGIAHTEGFIYRQDTFYFSYGADRYYNNKFDGSKLVDPTSVEEDGNGVGVSFDLPNDSEFGVIEYRYHRGYMSYIIDCSNPNIQLLGVRSHYLHQESTFTISPGISISKSGPSISVISYENKFTKPDKLPYLSLTVTN